MTKPRILAVALIVLLISAAAWSQTAAGRIEYVEGDVSVSRDGEFLADSLIAVGLEIREFDTVETGADGYLEVAMDAPSAGSVVKVRPGTVFYFEGTPRQESRFRTTFQLLRGSLAMKVGKLTNRESYEVQTDTAVMAVRGTEFSVDMSMDRSVLITVPEGRVESSTDMRTVVAEPGLVAFVDERASISSAAVDPADIELYREYWNSLRLDALKINARLSIIQYSSQWDQQKQRLASAIRELASHEEIFRKWASVANGRTEPYPVGEAIRDKRTVSPGMIELRAALPVAERAFQALVGLEEAWRNGYAEGDFGSGNYRNAAAFYRSFRRDKIRMRLTLSAARRMIRIYRAIERSAGPSLDSGGPDLMGSAPSL